MATRARGLWLVVVLAGPLCARPQNYLVPDAVLIDGLQIKQTVEAEDPMVWAIAQVVAEARLVYHDDLGLHGPETVQLRVAQADSAFPCVITDRAETVYANYSPNGSLGERRRGYPKQVGVLCLETAELYNPHRLPGLEQYLSATQAVPRAVDSLADKIWPEPYQVLASDGPIGFRQLILRPEVLEEHPEWAAAAAWSRIAESLGVAWLVQAVNAVTADGANGLAQVRQAAVAAKPELAAAFTAWDAATRLPPGDGGSQSICSFETDADRGGFVDLARAEFAISEDWATDGGHSGAVTFLSGAWPWMRVADVDWRHRDWTAFQTLEMDLKNLGDETIPLTIDIYDRVDRCHGWLYGWFDIPAGQTQHLVLKLRPTNQDAGQRVGPTRNAPWFDGEFRYGEVAELSITAREGPAYPYHFLVDNVKLVP